MLTKLSKICPILEFTWFGSVMAFNRLASYNYYYTVLKVYNNTCVNVFIGTRIRLTHELIFLQHTSKIIIKTITPES